MATHLPSLKPSKQNKQDILGTASEGQTYKQCSPMDSYTWTH